MKKTLIIQAQWQRFDKFKYVIQDLNNQTDKNFDLAIWNNNNHINPNSQLEMNASLADGYEVYIHTSPNNIMGFARFVLANNLLNGKFEGVDGSIYDKIIFYDDDQRVERDFVKYMVENYEEQSYKGRWGYTIHNDDYWNRTRVGTGVNADYVGTCGAVIDASIFKDDKFFKSYQYNPTCYWLEDLQLSLYCKSIGWKVMGLDDKHIETIVDHKDQSLKPNADMLKRQGYIICKKHYGIL